MNKKNTSFATVLHRYLVVAWIVHFRVVHVQKFLIIKLWNCSVNSGCQISVPLSKCPWIQIWKKNNYHWIYLISSIFCPCKDSIDALSWYVQNYFLVSLIAGNIYMCFNWIQNSEPRSILVCLPLIFILVIIHSVGCLNQFWAFIMTVKEYSISVQALLNFRLTTAFDILNICNMKSPCQDNLYIDSNASTHTQTHTYVHKEGWMISACSAAPAYPCMHIFYFALEVSWWIHNFNPEHNMH